MEAILDFHGTVQRLNIHKINEDTLYKCLLQRFKTYKHFKLGHNNLCPWYLALEKHRWSDLCKITIVNFNKYHLCVGRSTCFVGKTAASSGDYYIELQSNHHI